MTEKQSYDVFLSYSHEDRPWATELASALREAGVRAWFDVNEIRPGELWREKIQEALRDSRTFLIILSTAGVNSPWTFFELGAAVADKKRIIPVVTEDINLGQVPPLLMQYQFLRASSPKEAGKRVAEILEISENGPTPHPQKPSL